ncbi:MAG: HDIG domain-containing protein [Candidatus Aureabacteria bacterium]|nr:HDIG domain-containing protein [Candidatus Auribacterota bacterium]
MNSAKNIFSGTTAFKKLIHLVNPDRPVLEILMIHSTQVALKALKGAAKVPHMNPDPDFIYSASLLHDIGIIFTHAPEIDCHGEAPYLCHGYLGAELLRKEGLSKEALVCERHVGAGITLTEISEKSLPLPEKDFMPLSLEEKLIAWADKFYSKTPAKILTEKTIPEIVRELEKFSPAKSETFLEWNRLFNPPD